MERLAETRNENGRAGMSEQGFLGNACKGL